MKKYLFGLGAMIVGAGLMFALMHGEVSAEGEPKKLEPFVCSSEEGGESKFSLRHCETSTLNCALVSGGVSCVKKGMFK